MRQLRFQRLGPWDRQIGFGVRSPVPTSQHHYQAVCPWSPVLPVAAGSRFLTDKPKEEFTYNCLHLKHNILRNVGTNLGFSPGHITSGRPWDSVKINLTSNCLKSAVYSARNFSTGNYLAAKWGPMNKRKQGRKTQRPPPEEDVREFSLTDTLQRARHPPGERVFMRSSVCQARAEKINLASLCPQGLISL